MSLVVPHLKVCGEAIALMPLIDINFQKLHNQKLMLLQGTG
jgi:hypothetical protein